MKLLSLSPAVITALIISTASSVCVAQTNSKEGSFKASIVPHYSVREGGNNTGGTDDYFFNPWNNGVLSDLQETKESATFNFADNNLEDAIKRFADQLNALSLKASIPELQLSWTKKVTDLTINIASSLDRNIQNADDRVALFNVYLTAYDLIGEFYEKLDLAYVIPSYCVQCRAKNFKLDLPAYEQQLNRYIIRQGEWFTKRYVSGSNQYGTLPKYSPTIFLIALSTLSKGLAQDLMTDSATGPNLFPHQYESISSDLKRISDKIDQHLAGGSVFGSVGADGIRHDDRAIFVSYKNFMAVMSSIKVQ